VPASSVPGAIARFVIPLQPGEQIGGFSPPAVSPDGTHVAYVVWTPGRTQIYLRAMDRLDATAISAAQNATGPFFSADGQWLGFFRDRQIWKVAVSGGAPTPVCVVNSDPRGASWGPQDTIIFGQGHGPLLAVSAAGGRPGAVTTLDVSRGESSHRFPEVLPGGKVVLFQAGPPASDTWDDAPIVAQSLVTGERRVVVPGGSNTRFMSSGHGLEAGASSSTGIVTR